MTDEELEVRLENWGRWAFSGSGAKRRSMPLFCLIDRGEDRNAQARDVVSIDVEDALRVQAAWSSLPFRTPDEKSSKILLGMTYCEDCPRSAILKRIRKVYQCRIEARDAERLLLEAKAKIRCLLSHCTKIECAKVLSQSEAETRDGGQSSPLRAPRENATSS